MRQLIYQGVLEGTVGRDECPGGVKQGNRTLRRWSTLFLGHFGFGNVDSREEG